MGKYAADNNVPLAFNLSATFLIATCKADVLAGLANADYVFANEDEIDLFGTEMGIESKDRKDIALALAKYKKTNTNRQRVAIVTQGPLPALLAYYDVLSGEHVIKEYPIAPLQPE